MALILEFALTTGEQQRTKALTKGLAKYSVGIAGAKKLRFSCGSDMAVGFKRKTAVYYYIGLI